MDKTILDHLLAASQLQCNVRPVTVAEDELVHIAGAQEPVRDQPDERTRALLNAGWLTVESIQPALPEAARQAHVAKLQQSAREWMKHPPDHAEPDDQQQVRWITDKTRPHESKQQIVHRVWLSIVLYSLDCRGLRYDSEGQIHWDAGITGRIGLSPDGQLDLAWTQERRTVYVASFRAPDGSVARGKGRQRWHVYRLTIDPAAEALRQRRRQVAAEKIALIVASETYATQPQLPRDFYGGDQFQQACIDAQDQHFDHMLVLSPEHGVVSLDDMVPSDKAWSEVLERGVWPWQMLVIQQLGKHLSKINTIVAPTGRDFNGWLWLNPASTYTFTVFGGGFAVQVLFDHLLRAHARTPHIWPNVVLAEYRQGYVVEDFEDDHGYGFDFDDDERSDDLAYEITMQDVNQLLAWAADFVGLVAIHVPPTDEVWEIEADQALIPMRLLSDSGQDMDDLLDLLTDVMLLLEQPIPFTLVLNPAMAVSALLQIAHNLVHDETESVQTILRVFTDNALQQYVEKALQESSQEERLCACLTLAEQMQLLSLAIPPFVAEQLLIWMQTYISGRLRQNLQNANGNSAAPN